MTSTQLKDKAHFLRIHSINSTLASKSGHPTSCSSCAEILSVLFFKTMRYSIESPKDINSDRFILSKGHAAPILYAAWAEAGLFPSSELLNLRKIDSDLEGHPTPRLNFIDVGTGSLGQGLSIGCGMAYVGKHIDKASYRVYVLVGDGESAEGSIWEAMNFASYYKLDNLCIILDVNRLGQSEATCLQHDLEIYRKRADAFGANAVVVDGHDVDELTKAFSEAAKCKGKPTAIIAKTYKGKDFTDLIENMDNWHGKPLGDSAQKVIEHIKTLMSTTTPFKLQINAPIKDCPTVSIQNIRLDTPPSYQLGQQVATRLAYGTALAKIGKNNKRVLGLDGDTKNSTYSEKIKAVNPGQYIECYIAEQNLAGVAIGAACRDRSVCFASTFATFFTRAFDQIRMGAISQTNVNFVGSHCGVSIGEDGPSQMGLEDLALFRSIPGCTVFYPSDAVSCERAVEMAANTKGICYIRTSRPNTPVIYGNDHVFQIGKANIVKSSPNDSLLLIGSGITLAESLKAHQTLANAGINVRLMDLFTIKPIDSQALIKNALECGNRVLVVEDHYPEGGIGEAVCSALAMTPNVRVQVMAVREVPRSGPPAALLDKYMISEKHIVNTASQMVKN